MAKLVLLTIVMAMVGIPVIAARDPNARRGVRKVVLLMSTASVLYYFAIRYVYPRFL